VTRTLLIRRSRGKRPGLREEARCKTPGHDESEVPCWPLVVAGKRGEPACVMFVLY
jgi:hypothetical protein